MKPGETLVIRVKDWRPEQVEFYQEYLDHRGLPFGALVVIGDELAVGHAHDCPRRTHDGSDVALTRLCQFCLMPKRECVCPDTEAPATIPSCCDFHGRNCEPGDLCCEDCTEEHHGAWVDGHGNTPRRPSSRRDVLRPGRARAAGDQPGLEDRVSVGGER